MDASLAVLLAGAIADRSVLMDAGSRRAEIAIGSTQAVARRADSAVVVMVTDKVGAFKAAVMAGGFIEHRDVRLDAEAVKQRLLHHCPLAHHWLISAAASQRLNQAGNRSSSGAFQQNTPRNLRYRIFTFGNLGHRITFELIAEIALPYSRLLYSK